MSLRGSAALVSVSVSADHWRSASPSAASAAPGQRGRSHHAKPSALRCSARCCTPAAGIAALALIVIGVGAYAVATTDGRCRHGSTWLRDAPAPGDGELAFAAQMRRDWQRDGAQPAVHAQQQQPVVYDPAAAVRAMPSVWPSPAPGDATVYAHDWSVPLRPDDFLVLTLYQPAGKFAVFQSCDFGAYLHANRAVFAAEHGYRYAIDSRELDSTRHPAWGKVLALRDALLTDVDADGRPPPKYVLMVDADALFTRFQGDAPLERIVDLMRGADVAFGEDISSPSINTGVGMFKVTPDVLRLLRAVYSYTDALDENNVYWEQAAFIALLVGGSTGNSKSKPAEFAWMLQRLPQRALNSFRHCAYIDYAKGWWQPDDLTLHFAGVGSDFFATLLEAGDSGTVPPCVAGREEVAWLAAAAVSRARPRSGGGLAARLRAWMTTPKRLKR